MLSGIRVVELGNFITGPLAAMMLADLGAEVIKVERPEGDPFRRGHGSTYGPAFAAYNRNKKSVVIDTTTPQGRADLLALIDTADVLIDNFRPGVIEKLGLAPDVLRARNPRLIQCSITGFGAKGPYRDRPAFDTVGQALSGVASFLIEPEAPESFGPTVADNATGMYAAYGVMGALIERGSTGQGRRIEVNMLESAMAFIQDAYTNYTMAGIVGSKYSRIVRSQCFAFRCADGRLIGLHMSTTEKFWQELVATLEAPELGDDERFRTHQTRVKHYHELKELLAQRFLARTRGEWMALLEKSDVPFSPIHNVQEALEDPQVIALEAAVDMHHPQMGKVTSVACPLRVDGARPLAQMQAPPMIGEHTQEVMEKLGRG
jgi:crotonobetainyl-CoA:carnitine CoA-transferase CaiB-like acyl-CoA transferase